jgi:hypothetical protein
VCSITQKKKKKILTCQSLKLTNVLLTFEKYKLFFLIILRKKRKRKKKRKHAYLPQITT